nr:hypothetical protein [Rhizobium ruizarguesonis]
MDLSKLQWVLTQTGTPVAIRMGKGSKLQVRLPYAIDNKSWLRAGKRSIPDWLPNEKRWEIPQSWFNDFVNRALERYHRVYVVQPYHEHEVCAPACWNAVGHECQCSCMGANHGSGQSSAWFIASDTFAVRWGPRQLACRLLTKRP